MNSEHYKMHNGGRVKIAGGSVNTYYDCAQPMIDKGLSGASEVVENFKQLKNDPPLSLLLAFFPDHPKNIKQRLRGAGLYRHLRMDQGPGGNFTAFQLSENGASLQHRLTTESGYAMVEYPVQEQLATGQFGALVPLIDEIQSLFRKNEYFKTAQTVEQFQLLCAQSGLVLPNGENVGSKTGFFFIRPTETDSPTEFPLKLIPEVKRKVSQALLESESLAEYARQYLVQGHPYSESIKMAEKAYIEQGHTSYTGSGLLYFQPDCFVSADGKIEVEKINMPDVGFFLTQIDTQGNTPLSQVQKVNQRLKNEVAECINKNLTGPHITLVTRDEVISQKSDTLELLEIKALTESIQKCGKEVRVIPLSAYESLTPQTQVMLLNVEVEDPHFASLTEQIIGNHITCYPDPLLKTFQENATTLKKVGLGGKRLDRFLSLIKPKDFGSSNVEKLQAEVFKYLEIAGIQEDIIYVHIAGTKTPLPLFRYSLHSFSQIYNALEKQLSNGQAVEEIFFSPVPFNRENSVFSDQNGARLSAFRFMFSK
jgi:hypothetical protein